MSKAIAYHSGAYFIDMSSYIMTNYLDNKKNTSAKIFQCFKVCRDYGPCVIYVDCVDEYIIKKNSKNSKSM